MNNVKTRQEFLSNSLNEDDEVSVDKVLDAKTKKVVKNFFESTYTGIDKITFKKDGTIVAKRGFFYRHGVTSKSTADRLKDEAAKKGIVIDIVDDWEDWKPWPKDSNFVVVFKIVSVD